MLNEFLSDPLAQARLRKAVRDILLYDDDDIPDVLAFIGPNSKAKHIFMTALERAAQQTTCQMRRLKSLAEMADLPGNHFQLFRRKIL